MVKKERGGEEEEKQVLIKLFRWMKECLDEKKGGGEDGWVV